MKKKCNESVINRKARMIAFYLPQFHPIPENDKWWGKGFTEWTNVAKASPLFPGHKQPNIPGELGFYDLRLPETRIAQAQLAGEHGIEGFCYWHYWFGNGKRLLERPFAEVLASKKPDFPFCLGWANHSWKGVFFGAQGRTLVEQKYPGTQDYINHFNTVLPAFCDDRYITVDNKPLFFIFNPNGIPNVRKFTDLWREMANKAGLKGLYIVGLSVPLKKIDKLGIDAITDTRHRIVEQLWPQNIFIRGLLRLFRLILNKPAKFSYHQAAKYFLRPEGYSSIREHPVIVPNWDTTPRLGAKGVVLHDSTPELFRTHVKEALSKVLHKPYEHRIVFIRSWNEWAEGNYLEPDQRFGTSYLEVIKDEVLMKDRILLNSLNSDLSEDN